MPNPRHQRLASADTNYNYLLPLLSHFDVHFSILSILVNPTMPALTIVPHVTFGTTISNSDCSMFSANHLNTHCSSSIFLLELTLKPSLQLNFESRTHLVSGIDLHPIPSTRRTKLVWRSYCCNRGCHRASMTSCRLYATMTLQISTSSKAQ